MEIKDLRKKLIEYFSNYNYDVTFRDLVTEFNLDNYDLDKLDYCLFKLLEEGVIKKSECEDCIEYDPISDYFFENGKD